MYFYIINNNKNTFFMTTATGLTRYTLTEVIEFVKTAGFSVATSGTMLTITKGTKVRTFDYSSGSMISVCGLDYATGKKFYASDRLPVAVATYIGLFRGDL